MATWWLSWCGANWAEPIPTRVVIRFTEPMTFSVPWPVSLPPWPVWTDSCGWETVHFHSGAMLSATEKVWHFYAVVEAETADAAWDEVARYFDVVLRRSCVSVDPGWLPDREPLDGVPFESIDCLVPLGKRRLHEVSPHA